MPRITIQVPKGAVYQNETLLEYVRQCIPAPIISSAVSYLPKDPGAINPGRPIVGTKQDAFGEYDAYNNLVVDLNDSQLATAQSSLADVVATEGVKVADS